MSCPVAPSSLELEHDLTRGVALHAFIGERRAERVNDFETPSGIKLECNCQSLWWMRAPFSAG